MSDVDLAAHDEPPRTTDPATHPAPDGSPGGQAAAEGGRLSERISRVEAARRASEATDAEGRPIDESVYRSSGLGFRTRLTLALIAAAVLPVAGFGIVVLVVTGATGTDTSVARVLLLAVAVSVVFAVLLAALLAADLGAPLRAIARSVERVSAGEDPGRLELPGDDEFSRLAESHNRLARDLRRRNRELREIVIALEATSLSERPEAVVRRAAVQATERVRDDRLRAAARRSPRDPHRGDRARRPGARPGEPGRSR